jgi:hypothetical protein
VLLKLRQKAGKSRENSLVAKMAGAFATMWQRLAQMESFQPGRVERRWA